MELFVKTLTGHTICLIGVLPKTRMCRLKEMIRDIEEIPIDQQRLVFAGFHLEDEKPVSYYNITEGSTIHLVLILRGMISSFSFADASDPLTAYLLAEERTKELEPSKEQLDTRVTSMSAARKACYELRYTHNTLLDETERNTLITFSDAYAHVMNSRDDSRGALIDAKIVFAGASLALLDELLGCGTVEKLQRLHHCTDRYSKIVLRRTQGPLDGCIAFHTDGSYASRTVQLTLNGDDEYLGGRLCFYSPDVGLQIPRRPAGTLTIHPKEQLHGVTRLFGGKRYSLFVVDSSNGLGDTAVFVVDRATFDLLKPTRKRKAEKGAK